MDYDNVAQAAQLDLDEFAVRPGRTVHYRPPVGWREGGGDLAVDDDVVPAHGLEVRLLESLHALRLLSRAYSTSVHADTLVGRDRLPRTELQSHVGAGVPDQQFATR